ncbi:MAG: hypothetical protein K9M11_01290 [Candidatus Pacebacteria bacterium]|nr:hypothetical protein [Candidatus Paceibacterota bacterium]
MKKETLRQNLPAIIAISLPILLVLIIGFLSILPSLGPKPKYDFLFIKETSRSQYINNSCVAYSSYYDIENGFLVKKPYINSIFDKREVAEPCYGYSRVVQQEVPELFVYRTAEDTVYPISFEAATKLEVKGKTLSPDGFSVSKRIVNRGILELFGGANGGVYISKKNTYMKTSIEDSNDVSYYDNNFNFLTWIEPLQSISSPMGNVTSTTTASSTENSTN